MIPAVQVHLAFGMPILHTIQSC